METKLRTVTESLSQLGIMGGAVRDAIATSKITPPRFGNNGYRAGFIILPEEQVAHDRAHFPGKRGMNQRPAVERHEKDPDGSG